MEGQRVAKSVNADLNTLQKELEELHREAKRVAAQRTDQPAPEQTAMVVRGR